MYDTRPPARRAALPAPPQQAGEGASGAEPAALALQQTVGNRVARRLLAAPAAGTVQRTPLRYDNTAVTISPPKKPFTLKDAQSLVDQRKSATPADLTSAAVKGAAAGSDEEIFLWYILSVLGTQKRWGTEMDAVTPIGWPAKAGDPAPVGKVTVTIDDQGNGVAELLSAGAPAVPATYATVADAEKELRKTYGIGSVKNGDATWTVGELNKVIGAFALLPAADRTALAGVDLVRVQSLGGTTAGEFGSSESVTGTAVTIEASIKLSDRAFASDPVSFVGSAGAASPESFLTIVHEVGHAIATKARRDAGATHVRAIAASNQQIADHQAAIDVSNAAVNEYNAAVDVYNEAAKAGDRTAAAAAKKVVDEKKKAWDAALKVAAARQKAKEAGEKDVTAKEKARDATMVGEETARLHAFVAFVDGKKIKPFTTYAAENWPQKPEEFYAEAYSLWRTDPVFLKSNYPDLATWFEGGKYK